MSYFLVVDTIVEYFLIAILVMKEMIVFNTFYCSIKRMYLGWLRCLVCLASISAGFQYGDEGPAGNYSIFANRSVKPSPNNCACYDLQGKIYNLAPLQNKDGTARFASIIA